MKTIAIENIKKKIEDLETEIVLLKESLRLLEQEEYFEYKKLVPDVYEMKPKPYFPIFPVPNYEKRLMTCSKCGMQLSGVMGYCCPDSNCPTGLGPVIC